MNWDSLEAEGNLKPTQLTWTFICHYINAVKIALGCFGVLFASACDAKRRVCSFALVLT